MMKTSDLLHEPTNDQPNAEKGFSLIEIMLAMGVFAIGILAVAAMQLTAFQGNRSARLQTEATTLASQQIEEIISGPYADIQDGNQTLGQGNNINLQWIVADNSPVAKTKTLTMTVSWNDKGGQKNIVYTYIISDPA